MASFRSFVGSELMSIKQNIAAVRNMIPNNIKLKPSERRSMFKLNTKRQETASISRDAEILAAKIEQAKLVIKAKNLSIQTLGKDICLWVGNS